MAGRTQPAGGLRYYGGKHPATRRGRWINATIGPAPKRTSYIEPFAGMLGVLLQRPPVRIELANDANRWVVAWWRAVRDWPEEFARLIAATPRSRVLYDEAAETVLAGPPAGDPLRDALAIHVCIDQNMNHGPVPGRGRWAAMYSGAIGSTGSEGWTRERVAALAARLRRVQLECRDACAILERTRRTADALIYVDPPYALADTAPYGEAAARLDRGRLGDLLAAQAGRVAVSGYGDEWDGLGWHRSELADRHRPLGVHSGAKAAPRVEVLWTNFPPAGEGGAA
jgi:DNA adenine methylase